MQQGGRRPKRGLCKPGAPQRPPRQGFAFRLAPPASPAASPACGPVHRSGCDSPLITSGSALLEEIDELPRRRSSYIATIPWSAMRCCGGGCTMNYNTISAQRIAGALGAEIAGVEL